MGCYYHSDTDAVTQCSVCKKNLCGECSFTQPEGSTFCSRCLALEAARDASNNIDTRIKERAGKEKSRESKRRKLKRLGLTAQIAVILLCLVTILLYMPKIINGFNNNKPLRHGTYKTDKYSDKCISDLWRISKMLQQGQIPGDNIVSPVSSKPYEIIRTENDIIVRCPDPERYGLKDIRVSKLNPVPEVVK